MVCLRLPSESVREPGGARLSDFVPWQCSQGRSSSGEAQVFSFFLSYGDFKTWSCVLRRTSQKNWCNYTDPVRTSICRSFTNTNVMGERILAKPECAQEWDETIMVPSDTPMNIGWMACPWPQHPLRIGSLLKHSCPWASWKLDLSLVGWLFTSGVFSVVDDLWEVNGTDSQVSILGIPLQNVYRATSNFV